MRYLIAMLLLLFLNACTNTHEEVVVIHTSYGNMTVRLYEATPKHSANFIKRVKNGEYNGTEFHRVIREFMAQGGDIDAKLGNPPGQETLPKIPAEIIDSLFHKKGALAAARQHESVNPSLSSNGSQFYLVQGRIYTSEELMQMENRLNYDVLAPLLGKMLQQGELPHIRAQIDSLQLQRNMEGIAALVASQRSAVEARFGKQRQHRFSEKQRSVYTTQGGVPFLDGGYTVFGEVIEGLSVLDSICAQPVGNASKPLKPIAIALSIAKRQASGN